MLVHFKEWLLWLGLRALRVVNRLTFCLVLKSRKNPFV